MKRIKNGKRTALGGGPRGIDKYDDEVDGVDAHIHFFLVDDVIRFRVFFSFFLSFFSRFFFGFSLRLGFRMKWKQRLGACYQWRQRPTEIGAKSSIKIKEKEDGEEEPCPYIRTPFFFCLLPDMVRSGSSWKPGKIPGGRKKKLGNSIFEPHWLVRFGFWKPEWEIRPKKFPWWIKFGKSSLRVNCRDHRVKSSDTLMKLVKSGSDEACKTKQEKSKTRLRKSGGDNDADAECQASSTAARVALSSLFLRRVFRESRSHPRRKPFTVELLFFLKLGKKNTRYSSLELAEGSRNATARWNEVKLSKTRYNQRKFISTRSHAIGAIDWQVEQRLRN